MATIRRHPIPPESYQPDRPLNDLGRDQLEHFRQVAERLPVKDQAKLPAVPSAEQGMAASQFIAAVTELLMVRKRQPLKIVSKRSRKAPGTGLALAATATVPPVEVARKRRPRSKSKPKSTKP